MAPLIQILRPEEVSKAAAKNAEARSSMEAVAAVVERLRQYSSTRAQTTDRGSAVEGRCEFCGAAMEESHGHIVDLEQRALVCVCRPCYLLFTFEGAGGRRFRAVPERYARVPELAQSREQLDALDLPIGLAFFFRSSVTGRVTAFYPSPAGATESELPLAAWEALERDAPAVATLAPDVEALLVRRLSSRPTGQAQQPMADGSTPDDCACAGETQAVIVPIDACYELVGRIRRAWRGFQGGDEVWCEIDDFFARVRARAEGP